MSDLSLAIGDKVQFRIGVHEGDPIGSLITGTIMSNLSVDRGSWWGIQSDALCDYCVHRDGIEEKL